MFINLPCILCTNVITLANACTRFLYSDSGLEGPSWKCITPVVHDGIIIIRATKAVNMATRVFPEVVFVL